MRTNGTPTTWTHPPRRSTRRWRAAPALPGLLDTAFSGFEVPGYLGNELEHAHDVAVSRILKGLPPEQLEALRELAEVMIRDGDTENPDGLTMLDPDHVIHTVRVRDIAAYEALRDDQEGHDPEQREEIKPWGELSPDERARIITDCSFTLEDNAAIETSDLVDEVRRG